MAAGETLVTRDERGLVVNDHLSVIDGNSRRYECDVPASCAIGVSFGTVVNAVKAALQAAVNTGTAAPGPATLGAAQVLAIARSVGSKA